MSNFNQTRDPRLVSTTTVSMKSPMFLSGNQALQTISLLSPLPLDAPLKNAPQHHQQYHTLLTINTYSCAPSHHTTTDAKVGYEIEGGEFEVDSPEDRDCYYDHQDVFYSPGLPSHQTTVDMKKLPPIPTYNESQMAYHPNGVKRLPHFHPQKFSKRLRTIINQRRRPQPLSLHIPPPPQPKSYFSPSPTPCESGMMESARSNLFQAILRVFPVPQRYIQVEDGRLAEEYEDVQDGSWWREVDHRVFIMGIIGLLLLAFGLGAWAMALYTA